MLRRRFGLGTVALVAGAALFALWSASIAFWTLWVMIGCNEQCTEDGTWEHSTDSWRWDVLSVLGSVGAAAGILGAVLVALWGPARLPVITLAVAVLSQGAFIVIAFA